VIAASTLERVLGPARQALSLALLLQIALSARSTNHIRSVLLLRDFVKNCRLVGESIARLPSGTLATESIGIIGYLAWDRPILDLVGLADAHIARTPHLPGSFKVTTMEM